MTALKLTLLTMLLGFASYNANAQSELLSELPQIKEEFVSSEKKVLATIDWLENTPVNDEKDLHKSQQALLVGWITNSPTVTLEINTNILNFTKKNAGLLIIFMGGWTRYCLLNNYSKDQIQGSIAGIRSAIKVFKAGDSKNNKEMQELVELDEKGELDTWVTEKLSKK